MDNVRAKSVRWKSRDGTQVGILLSGDCSETKRVILPLVMSGNDTRDKVNSLAREMERICKTVKFELNIDVKTVADVAPLVTGDQE